MGFLDELKKLTHPYAEEEDLCDIEGKDRYFIIDPIDGTANFVRGLHHSCISVGLYAEGRMEAAVVYNPYAEEFFTAVHGQGAYLNGKRLQMSQVDTANSLVLFGSAIRLQIPECAQSPGA